MNPPSSPFLSVAEVRAIDQQAATILKIPTLLLMENAGRNAAEFIHQTLTCPQQALILCGTGNNGGDGLVIARHLRRLRWDIQVWMVGSRTSLSPDCATNLAIVEACEIPVHWIEKGNTIDTDLRTMLQYAPVIVDSLLGTGSNGELRSPLDLLVQWANESPAIRIAIDQPTGMNADTGHCGSPCFHAMWTITFVACKTGFQLPEAAPFLGQVVVADIGIPYPPTLEISHRLNSPTLA